MGKSDSRNQNARSQTYFRTALQCNVFLLPDRYILATAGYPTSESKLTEIIDVLDPTKSCTLDGTADYPVETEWMPAGGVINGKAVACGGDSKNCYVFENRYQS